MSETVNMTKEIAKDGTESITYSKAWEKNGLNHRKEVRKVEGGYIITESKHGKPKDEGDDGEWIDERKEYVTTENPFEKKEEEKKDDQNMFAFVDTPLM